MEILTIVISVFASIVSGTVLFFLKNFFNKREKAEQQKEKVRTNETVLVLKSINALGKLTKANSIALKNGRANGDMEIALTEYSKIEKELFEFLLNKN